MKNIRLSIILFKTVFLLTACSESIDPAPTTFYHAFTGSSKKTWIITNFEWTGEGKNDTPLGMYPCEADDRYTFYANTDRQYQITNGRQKCSASETDLVVDDSWSFVNATSTLTIYFPVISAGPVPFFVRSVTDAQMVLEVYLDQENRYTVRFTLNAVKD